jgi:hypothetical protein
VQRVITRGPVRRVPYRPRQWTGHKAFILFVRLGLDKFLQLVFKPRRGFQAVTIQSSPGFGARVLVKFTLSEFNVKKIVVGASGSPDGPRHLAPVESNTLHKFPSLVAHSCVTKYDDGDARIPGWWTVKTQGAAWIVQLKDPNACAQLQAIGETLDDALALAELLLSSESAPWEPDPFLKRRTPPTKK